MVCEAGTDTAHFTPSLTGCCVCASLELSTQMWACVSTWIHTHTQTHITQTDTKSGEHYLPCEPSACHTHMSFKSVQQTELLPLPLLYTEVKWKLFLGNFSLTKLSAIWKETHKNCLSHLQLFIDIHTVISLLFWRRFALTRMSFQFSLASFMELKNTWSPTEATAAFPTWPQVVNIKILQLLLFLSLNI